MERNERVAQVNGQEKVFQPLGQFRSSPVGASLPPSRWVSLIACGAIDGFWDGDVCYIERGAKSPIKEPKPVWVQWVDDHYREMKKSAKRRNLKFDVTKEDVIGLIGDTDGRCAVTGIRFTQEKPEWMFRRPWMPSLDRIDSRGDYTLENCRVVCVAVNNAMNEFGLDVLMKIARELTASCHHCERSEIETS